MQTTAVDLALRDRLRDYSPLLSLLSQDTRRIDIDDPGLGGSFVTVFRGGGAPVDHINTDEALITFDCWSATSWASANRLARAVSDCLRSTHHETYGDTLIDWCSVLSLYDSPPDEPGMNRFVVTALVRVKRAPSPPIPII